MIRAITPGHPLHFTMKVREISNRDEKASILKRSHSTKIGGLKNGIKAFGTKIFGKSEEQSFEISVPMTHSGSCASFSSITKPGFHRDQVNGSTAKAYQVRTGQYNVINSKEWLDSISTIEQKTLSFYQSDWDSHKSSFFSKSSEMVTLGKVQMQALYIQALNPMVSIFKKTWTYYL